MRKLLLLTDELEKSQEENQRLLIENDFLRSKCAKIEQEVTDRMLKEEIIRMNAPKQCSLTGEQCFMETCENCPELTNWPWK